MWSAEFSNLKCFKRASEGGEGRVDEIIGYGKGYRAIISKPHRCVDCGQRYRSLIALNIHRREFHKT